jgi:hypothetical protein
VVSPLRKASVVIMRAAQARTQSRLSGVAHWPPAIHFGGFWTLEIAPAGC